MPTVTTVRKRNKDRKPGDLVLTTTRGGAEKTAGLSTKAIALREKGKTFAEIGEALNVSRSHAYGLVKRAISRYAEVATRSIEEMIERDNEMLDLLMETVSPMALDGNLDAVDRVLKIMTRRAALFGLDAPKRTEIDSRVRTLNLNALANLKEDDLNKLRAILTKADS